MSGVLLHLVSKNPIFKCSAPNLNGHHSGLEGSRGRIPQFMLGCAPAGLVLPGAVLLGMSLHPGG